MLTLSYCVRIILGAYVLLFASVCIAAVSVVDRNSATGWEVTTANAGETVRGWATNATFSQGNSTSNGAGVVTLALEADVVPVRLSKWCVNVSNATAAAGLTVILSRRTTASVGSLLHVPESVTGGANTASFHYVRDGTYTGIVRSTPTLGTLGATLDQQGFFIGELAGTEEALRRFCKSYDGDSGKAPILTPGATSGISLSVGSSGSGGRSLVSISLYTELVPN